MNLKCMLGLHNWCKWSQPFMRDVIITMDGIPTGHHYQKAAQVRTCHDCGKVTYRYV